MKGIIFYISLLHLIGCVSRSTSGPGEQLAGLYKMYAIQSQDHTGAWKESGVANGGESYIIYDGLGHMAVQIMPKGYETFQWMEEEDALNKEKFRARVDGMSVRELKEAVSLFASNYTYVANYKVDPSENEVTHQRLIGSIPAIWGTEVKRRLSFSGDTLILLNPLVNRRLTWIRQK